MNRSIKIFRPGSALILALFPEIKKLNELHLEPKAVHGHIYLFHMRVVYPALILALFPEIRKLNKLELEPKAVHEHIYLFHMCVVYPLPGRKCFDGRLEQFENTFVEITLNMFA